MPPKKKKKASTGNSSVWMARELKEYRNRILEKLSSSALAERMKQQDLHDAQDHVKLEPDDYDNNEVISDGESDPQPSTSRNLYISGDTNPFSATSARPSGPLFKGDPNYSFRPLPEDEDAPYIGLVKGLRCMNLEKINHFRSMVETDAQRQLWRGHESSELVEAVWNVFEEENAKRLEARQSVVELRENIIPSLDRKTVLNSPIFEYINTKYPLLAATYQGDFERFKDIFMECPVIQNNTNINDVKSKEEKLLYTSSCCCSANSMDDSIRDVNPLLVIIDNNDVEFLNKMLDFEEHYQHVHYIIQCWIGRSSREKFLLTPLIAGNTEVIEVIIQRMIKSIKIYHVLGTLTHDAQYHPYQESLFSLSACYGPEMLSLVYSRFKNVIGFHDFTIAARNAAYSDSPKNMEAVLNLCASSSIFSPESVVASNVCSFSKCKCRNERITVSNPLHIAATRNCLPMIEFLLMKYPNIVDIEDEYGLSALEIAFVNRHHEAAALIDSFKPRRKKFNPVLISGLVSYSHSAFLKYITQELSFQETYVHVWRICCCRLWDVLDAILENHSEAFYNSRNHPDVAEVLSDSLVALRLRTCWDGDEKAKYYAEKLEEIGAQLPLGTQKRLDKLERRRLAQIRNEDVRRSP